MPMNRMRAVLTKHPGSMNRLSYPSLARPRRGRRGGGVWDTFLKYGSQALGSLASSAWSGLKSAAKAAAPTILGKIGEWITSPSEEEEARALAKEHEREAAEARRKQDIQLELEERRLAAEEKRREAAEAKAEKEREEFARRHAPSEQSVTQSRGQAELFIRQLKQRYPMTFQQYPQYEKGLLEQVLGALLAPEDPSDPLAAQKTIGDIEMRIAQIESRINPRGAEAPQYTPDVRSLRPTGQYRTSQTSRRGMASSAGRGAPLGLCDRGRRTSGLRQLRPNVGGGIAGVLRA
jgi:hypothetical protein